MHIGIDIGLQQLKSEVFDGLLPEEKDWVLNEAQLRFIDEQSKPISNPMRRGLQSTQTRTDNISELITSATLPTYVRDGKSVFSILPTNYFNLINDRSNIINNCRKAFASYTTQNANYCEIDWLFESSIAANSGSILNTVTINGTVIFNRANYSSVLNTKPQAERDLIFRDLIIENINNLANVSAYWEGYLDIFAKGSIIIIDSNSSLCTTNSMVVTYENLAHIITPSDPQLITTRNFTGTAKTLTRYVFSNNDLTYIEEVPNRLTKTEEIFTKLVNPFHTTIIKSPISILEQNGIAVYHNKKFILNEIFIDYIRKPRTISLILGQNCELYDINNNHQKVVNIAVDLLAARMLAPNYQINKVENLKT